MKGHITSAQLRTIFTCLDMAFNNGYRLNETKWNKIAWETPSTSARNDYPFLGMTGKYREWIDDRVINRLKLHGYSIENKTYEQTHGINRDVLEDDQYRVYMPLFEMLGIDSKMFPEEKSFQTLKDGHKNLCYDGQNFFDNEHPVNTKHDLSGDIVPVSNIIESSQSSDKEWYVIDNRHMIKPIIYQNRVSPVLEGLDLSTDTPVWEKNEIQYGSRLRAGFGYGFWQMAIKIMGDINGDHLQKAVNLMRSFQGDGAKRLNFRASAIVCPGSDYEDVYDLIHSEFISGTSNPMYKFRNRLEIIDSDYLDPDLEPLVP